MSTSVTAALGVVFLVLSGVTTALMFQFWGYPYDKERRKSACPQWKMNIHRGLGLAYAAIYVLMMIEMVPRMWEYQVELPARTVAHLLLGMTIGAILLIKLSILRFFRHFEEWMPVLGALLFVCTLLLSALSLPFVAEERALVAAAPGGSAFSDASRARVAALLPTAELPEDTELEPLSSEAALRHGREVLLGKCVQCHDLKTAIARPRTPSDWWRTVKRMAEKPTLGTPLTQRDQLAATAFLVSITPDLQQSAKDKREAELAQQQTKRAAQAVAEEMAASDADADPDADERPEVDLARAKEVFEDVCDLCHDAADIEDAPPATTAEVSELVSRMVDNGMDAEPEEIRLVEAYLHATYVTSP